LRRGGGGDEIQIPEHPGAREDESHAAGMMGLSASVRRVVTDDSFDDVLAFYQRELAAHDPELMLHALDDGRQAALSMAPSARQSVTVAIQELPAENVVAISIMKVGK
jgi:hypothetical protein